MMIREDHVYNEETMETNVEGVYIAGVIAAGNKQMKYLLKMAVFMEKK